MTRLLRLFAFSSLLLLPVVSLQARGQTSGEVIPSDRVVGRAGKAFIGEDEFVRRFELLPGLYRHIASRMNEEKLIVMYSLIAEKLLAQEAEARGMDLDSLTVAETTRMTALLARDALYRKEIAGAVDVTADEMRKGTRDAQRTLLLRYLSFHDANDARFVRSHLQGRTLNEMTVDSSFHAVRDTVTLAWGVAEWPIEKGAFALTPGEVSPVIAASDGFYILQLLYEDQNTFYAGMQTAVREERVKNQIRLRKEEARLREFLNSFLPGHTAFAVSREIKSLAFLLSKAMAPSDKDSAYVLDQVAVNDVIAHLGENAKDTMLVAGPAVWSTGDIVRRLYQSGFTSQSRNPLAIANAVNGQCRIWGTQELLAQEALHRGLEKDVEVQKQEREWRDAYLSQVMRARIEDSVSISDADVYRYLEKYGEPLPTPRVQVRELSTTSLEDMQHALADLEAHVPFKDVVVRYSTDETARASAGLSGFFKVTERPPIGELAAEMSIGQMYGPIRAGKGLLLFELVARQDSVDSDTTLVHKKRAAAENLLRLARKAHLDEFIARSAATKGFSVFEDRIRALDLSPIPMMTFRSLGFGGRIFAAPLMPRLFEWVNIDVPTPVVVP